MHSSVKKLKKYTSVMFRKLQHCQMIIVYSSSRYLSVVGYPTANVEGCWVKKTRQIVLCSPTLYDVMFPNVSPKDYGYPHIYRKLLLIS
jgi:hypothetical protein